MSARENIYKSRDVGVVDVIFQADSFDELITQMDMMERLGNSDVDTVHAIAAYKRDIKDRRIKLDADEKTAARLVADREQHKNELIALEADLQDLTSKIKKQIKKLKAQAQPARPARPHRLLAAPSRRSTPTAPATPRSWPSRSATSACPTCGAAPARAASTAPASPCTATRRSASACRTAPPTSSARARRSPSRDLRPGDLIFFGNAELQPPRGHLRRGTTCIEARTPATSCATAPSPGATPGSAGASRASAHSRTRGPAASPPGPSASTSARIVADCLEVSFS